MNLDQAVCIVTGSSSGVGAATAKMMAARGARVVINYSRSEAAAALQVQRLEVSQRCQIGQHYEALTVLQVQLRKVSERGQIRQRCEVSAARQIQRPKLSA